MPAVSPFTNASHVPQGTGVSSASAESDNSFTRANAFGLFLTLSICLLVQPTGSFLFSRRTSRLGRVLFFLWRLNPVACIAEAIFIFAASCDVILDTIKRRRRSGCECLGFWTAARISLAAVFFLREQCRTLEPVEFSDDEDSRRGRVPEHSPITGPRNPIDAAAQTTINDRSDLMLPKSSDQSDDRSPHSDPSSVRDGADVVDGVPATLEPSQSPVEISSEDQTRTPNSSSDTERSRAIRHLISQYNAPSTLFSATLRGNGYEYTEGIIKTINLLSMIILIIKLSFIKAPLHVMCAGWFMVTHLAVLQILQLGQAQGQLQDAELHYLEDRAIRLSNMEDTAIAPILRVFVLVLSCYCISHLGIALFTLQTLNWALPRESFFTSDCYGRAEIYDHLYSISRTTVLFVSALFGRQPAPSDTETRYAPKQHWCSKLAIVLFIDLPHPLLALDWGAFDSAPKVADSRNSWMANVVVILGVNAYLECFIFLPLLKFPERSSARNRRNDSPLVLNLFFPLVILILQIIYYDKSQTYKSEWLDWLGK